MAQLIVDQETLWLFDTALELSNDTMSLDTIQIALGGLSLGIRKKHGPENDNVKFNNHLSDPGSGLQPSPATSALVLLRWYYRVSKQIHPGITVLSLKRRAFFVWQCIRFGGMLRRWESGQAGSSLKHELEQWPEIIAFVERPYLNVSWSAEQRLAVVQTHYRIADAGPSLLRLSSSDRVSLLALDHIHSGLSVVLDRPAWSRWEGELVISLFNGDERIYLLAFTLGTIANENVAYVGTLKGGAQPDMRDTYRTLTHELEGMRPRDFLFACFRLFCQALEIQRILAVSDATRLHRSTYLGFNADVRVFVNYDDIWKEFYGVPFKGGFFEIGVPIVYRTPEQIPARKRAQYRRRYEMLKHISAQISGAVTAQPQADLPATESKPDTGRL